MRFGVAIFLAHFVLRVLESTTGFGLYAGQSLGQVGSSAALVALFTAVLVYSGLRVAPRLG
ncbi:hypothetical protein [Haloarchaeobius sp. DFWS5]|uniref:hypothetical protein n=1 Tax=Haloarchaeobius sp. DFWS5 TaxID=3446114 RepID=UPI003EBF8541